MRQTKATNIALICAFLLLLLLPLALSDFQGGHVSYAENRRLAKFPTLAGGLFESRAAIEEWIDDNVGGRETAFLLYNKMNYRLTGLAKAGNYEGREKWLYQLRDEGYLQLATNANIPSAETLARLRDNTAAVTETLAARGIPLVVSLFPTKYEIYPEYMPGALRVSTEPTHFGVMDAALSGHPGIHYTSPRDALLEKKAERLTFPVAKDGGHWNNYGAFLAYQNVMEAVQKQLPDIRILSDADFDITEEPFETALNSGYHYVETDLVYTLKEPKAEQVKDHLLELGMETTDQFRSYDYYRNEDESLPRAVVIGDSMTWMFMLEHFAQSFSELAFINRQEDFAVWDWTIDTIQPDVVLALLRQDSMMVLSRYVPQPQALDE